MIQVVKIGGNVVDNPQLLHSFCSDFAKLEGPKILVHGGGVMASRVQQKLGHIPLTVEGRRVTDRETLKVVTAVYAGWCNKSIVALLQAEGCNALGLSGCDASVITARRRPPQTLSNGKDRIDFGYVGDVNPMSVNKQFIEILLQNGITPVFCAINHDGRGNLLNTNADTIASSLTASLGAKLVYCFEKSGVLLNKDDDNSVIPHIDSRQYTELLQAGIIADGMIPKLKTAFDALQGGASEVCIKHASMLLHGGGTTITI